MSIDHLSNSAISAVWAHNLLSEFIYLINSTYTDTAKVQEQITAITKAKQLHIYNYSTTTEQKNHVLLYTVVI